MRSESTYVGLHPNSQGELVLFIPNGAPFSVAHSRVGIREPGHRVRPTGICSGFGKAPDSSNSGMDTNCSVIYWTRRALSDRASVTTASSTEQHGTRVKGCNDLKDPPCELIGRGGTPSLVHWALAQAMPQVIKGSTGVECVTAQRAGAEPVHSGSSPWLDPTTPSQPSVPGPLWVWLENTKADPMQDIKCERRWGLSICSF